MTDTATQPDTLAPQDAAAPPDRFQGGNILTGRVTSLSSQEAELDLGDGAVGVLSCRHYTSGLMIDLTEELNEGDELEAAVLIREDHHKRVVLSRIWARSQRAWQKIMEAESSGEVIEVRVAQVVKGGLAVLLDEVRGFLPLSLLMLTELPSDVAERLAADAEEEHKTKAPAIEELAVEESKAEAPVAAEEMPSAAEASAAEESPVPPASTQTEAREFEKESILEALVGHTIPCKVIEVNQKKNKFIVSHNAAVWARRRETTREILEGLSQGDTVEGKVVELADFGTFIDIGGVRGLLHRKETAWNHGPDPGKLFDVGDSVTCLIAKINLDKGQALLSLKTGENPVKHVQVGQILKGRVDRLAYSGAIVALDPEISVNGKSREAADQAAAGHEASNQATTNQAEEKDQATVTEISHKCQLFGYLPVEEMAENTVKQPQRLVVPGDEVTVKVINLDKKKARVDLSIIEAIIPAELLVG